MVGSGGPGMNTGNMKRKITIRSKTTAKDSEGFVSETWADFLTTWAEVEPLRGREYFQAAAINAENYVRFRIRYHTGINNTMRLIYNNRTFRIISVIDVNERHIEIQLMCSEVVKGG